jgi:hypothetical protein
MDKGPYYLWALGHGYPKRILYRQAHTGMVRYYSTELLYINVVGTDTVLILNRHNKPVIVQKCPKAYSLCLLYYDLRYDIGANGLFSKTKKWRRRASTTYDVRNKTSGNLAKTRLLLSTSAPLLVLCVSLMCST